MRVDGRVADHDVDPAIRLLRLGDEVLALRPVGDAAGNRDRLAALFLDRRDDLLAGVEVAGGDHHLGAGLGKGLRHRSADAARRAGHYCDFPGKVEEIHTDSLSSSSPGLTRGSKWMAGSSPAMT